MAGQLIDAASGPVDWSAYLDCCAEDLRTLVKAKGQVQGPAEPQPVAFPLLESLQQSLANLESEQETAPRPPGAHAAETQQANSLMLPDLLAIPAAPFDSPDHVFEMKWDGVRALAAAEANGVRLWGHKRSAYTVRYPELSALRHWPPGTLVDGELVMLKKGLPDLASLLARHALTDPWKIRLAPRWCPGRYIVFDLLYHPGRCLPREPFCERRERRRRHVRMRQCTG